MSWNLHLLPAYGHRKPYFSYLSKHIFPVFLSVFHSDPLRNPAASHSCSPRCHPPPHSPAQILWTPPPQTPGSYSPVVSFSFAFLHSTTITVYLWLISLAASKELSLLLLKLYNDGAIGISSYFPGLCVLKAD